MGNPGGSVHSGKRIERPRARRLPGASLDPLAGVSASGPSLDPTSSAQSCMQKPGPGPVRTVPRRGIPPWPEHIATAVPRSVSLGHWAMPKETGFDAKRYGGAVELFIDLFKNALSRGAAEPQPKS